MRVASILVGDTSQGQSCCSADHLHYGAAPEAVAFYARLGDEGQADDQQLIRGINKVLDYDVDALNLSLLLSSPLCSLHSGGGITAALEAAYADGVFIGEGAGNDFGPSQGTCKVKYPASLPSVFTVNGLAGSSYAGATIHAQSSSRGGGSAMLNGALCANCYSVIGLATDADAGWYGSWPLTFTGTSYSTPLVVGAALDVKDQFLSAGNTWVNSPGRLHTIMLAMGDRHPGWHGKTSSATADALWGFGRLRMRRFESGSGLGGSWGWNMRTYSWTSGSSSKTYVPWSTPIPAGVDFIKCVTMADETYRVGDNSDQMSDIVTSLRIKPAVNGVCSTSASGEFVQATDWSYDYQDFVAIEFATLPTHCAVVELQKYHVPSDGIATHTFCYYSQKADYEDTF